MVKSLIKVCIPYDLPNELFLFLIADYVSKELEGRQLETIAAIIGNLLGSGYSLLTGENDGFFGTLLLPVTTVVRAVQPIAGTLGIGDFFSHMISGILTGNIVRGIFGLILPTTVEEPDDRIVHEPSSGFNGPNAVEKRKYSHSVNRHDRRLAVSALGSRLRSNFMDSLLSSANSKNAQRRPYLRKEELDALHRIFSPNVVY